jgi:hypothetical protein
LKNFYDMLSVAPDAPADEIKKAFRREIARYHPDKVQHLGPEFQEMASGMAADLTEAYRILMDPPQRAKYDADLFGASAAGAPSRPPRPPAHEDPRPPPSASASSSPADPSAAQAPPAPRPSAGVEFVKKASLSRLKDAVDDVMGGAELGHAAGFELAVTSKPKRGLFKKAEDPVRLLVKFVPIVDADAVVDVWSAAMRARVAGATLCVLLVGAALAPSKDLATAIGEQRRKARNAGPILVPVDVRDWEALVPPDTPASVRLLLQRLKEETR